jgi:polyhydroxyalkanoate synthase subunit PhaC
MARRDLDKPAAAKAPAKARTSSGKAAANELKREKKAAAKAAEAPKPVAKRSAKSPAKTPVTAPPKTVATPPAKAASTKAAKPAAKTSAKPPAASTAKTQAKSASKSAPKPSAKVASQPAAKAAVKEATKAAPPKPTPPKPVPGKPPILRVVASATPSPASKPKAPARAPLSVQLAEDRTPTQAPKPAPLMPPPVMMDPPVSKIAAPKPADAKPTDATPAESKAGPASDTADDPFKLQALDVERLAGNIARMVELGGKALAAYLKPRETGEHPTDSPEGVAEVTKTLGHVAEFWLKDPSRAVAAQTEIATRYMDLWSKSLKAMAGEPVEPAVKPDPRDARFKDPQWEKNPFFDFLKQFYLVTTSLADKFVNEAELDEHLKHKAAFYAKQIANALSPSNFVVTNPELLRETISSNAENLVRGMKMFAEDIERGGGDLKIRQSDDSQFALGVNLAMTPGKVVFENDLIQLIQYEPTTPSVGKIPLVIVPPWINKFYILDLTQEKSFIRWAVSQGLTVFVVSWVNPDQRHAHKSFDDYMLEGPLAAFRVAGEITGEEKVHAIGYCVGGTLLAVALAYMAARDIDLVETATFFTTQVDFTYAGDLKVFVDEEQIQTLEKRMAQTGYLEGKQMANAFNMLRSNDLIWSYFVNNYMKGKQPMPFDLLYWNADSPRMPAANHSFYLRHCYLQNDLSQGRMVVAGETLDLKKVKVPVYNLAAREDHIAPARSVFLGSQSFGGPVDYVMAGSGHIAGVVNPPEKKKYQFWTGGRPEGAFEDWVAKAEEHPGSWWPHWREWIRSHDGEEVPARRPGSNAHPPIEDAPGRYVKVKD